MPNGWLSKDHLTTYKFAAKRYEEGGSVWSRQTSTKISIVKAWMKVDENNPGERFSLKPTWDNVTEYVSIYRRIIICLRHWPPACLRSWAEFNFVRKPVIVGDENILCEHHLRTQRRFHPYLRVEWLRIAPIRSAFRANFSDLSATHRRCAGDPLEQIAEHFQLQPATTSQVDLRDIYENQALYGLYGYMRPQKVYGFSAVLVINRVSNMDYGRILSRHQLARVTREMSERSQHALQQQFGHVVEPRKLNEAEKRRTNRLICSYSLCI